MPAPVVTFDLFSALIDSRSGGVATFTGIGRARRWAVDGGSVYDRWDALNKAAQRDCESWVPFRELSRRSLVTAYSELGIEGDADADVDYLVASMRDWPLWPDVAEHLPQWAADGGVAGHRLGLLSNVDDDIFRITAAAEFLDPDAAMTSQRLAVYKPDPRIYLRARDLLGSETVHVASSARDVRGVLDAGCPMVRLRRPGHDVDPKGPTPRYEMEHVRELPGVLDAIARA